MTEKKTQENKTLAFSIDSLTDKIAQSGDIKKKEKSTVDKTLNMELHHHMAPPGGIIDDLD